MDDREVLPWILLGICGLMALNLRIHSKHLKLHDDVLDKIVHGDPDAELAAMSPAKEA